MAAKLKIQDGNPIWLSPSIIPSKDTVVSPTSTPSTSAIKPTSADVFVYVKVENTGTVDLGTCTCPTGAWTLPTLFAGFFASVNGSTSQSQGGFTFSATSLGDSISGTGVNFSFGLSASGRRAWAWSPDGRYFAYAASPSGMDWSLTIVALQAITRSNGTTVAKGAVAAQTNGVFAGLWNNSNFGWSGSKAVSVGGLAAGGSGLAMSLTCPEAPSGASWGTLMPDFPGQVAWAVLASPCGSAVAYAPKRLNTSAPPQDFFLISTATAMSMPFKKNNLTTSISSTGANVSLTTTAHTANGVTVNSGNGTMVTVDSPDCTSVGGGVTVRVDRVKASTLPSANLGVITVGTATIGQLLKGKSAWVQVPNTAGWANQSEPHWCLLAQAYTFDGTTVPRAWNGQATTPPAFPVNLENCSQRNITIA